MNKIPPCGVAVISNPTVCDVCVFHTRCKMKFICGAVVSCLTFLRPEYGESSDEDDVGTSYESLNYLHLSARRKVTLWNSQTI